jgi:hypothetical protein
MPPSAEAEDWILRVALSVGEEATALHAELGSKLLQLSAELQTQVPFFRRCGLLVFCWKHSRKQPSNPVVRWNVAAFCFAGC